VNDLKSALTGYGQLTKKYIYEYISKTRMPDRLRASMLYSIEAGGKMLRPALLLGTCEIFLKSRIREALPFAAAIEMIHTYSLVHDDLPAMDDDDTRRGKPSNHMEFGEDGAILAGDALLNGAYECMLDAMVQGEEDILQKIKAASTIAKASGAGGMVGGQSLDMTGSSGQKVEIEKLNSMKTGSLIRAAVEAGTLLGGADDRDTGNLREYAGHIGIAFQLTDDILDETADEKTLGKPVNSDKRNKKNTMASVIGIAESRRKADEHIEKALKYLEKVEYDTWFLRNLAEYIRNRKY
jgi:geranylgeranyl diphosphate synthase type II